MLAIVQTNMPLIFPMATSLNCKSEMFCRGTKHYFLREPMPEMVSWISLESASVFDTPDGLGLYLSQEDQCKKNIDFKSFGTRLS